MAIKRIDEIYSNALGIFNPYKSLPYRITDDIPRFDIHAFNRNPAHNFVYDKLFIAKSQGMKCGDLKTLKNKKVEFPIFIKPRYGHKTASSKNCYIIRSNDALQKHVDKPEMMWSEFIQATEGMTDFILVNGYVVYQLTYVYSEKQHGFADEWKYISPKSTPPPNIVEWVEKNLADYTGPVNVQYRSIKIIEIGLRFARSGMYIESTENKQLITNINDMWKHKTWNHKTVHEIEFVPYYSFKCWSPIPMWYLLPQHVVDYIVHSHGGMQFYEYYFEPTGNSSLIFFQHNHKDFNRGMRLKKVIERLAVAMNVLVALLLVVGIALAVTKKSFLPLLVAASLLMTSLINSIDVLFHQVKNQKQFVGL